MGAPDPRDEQIKSLTEKSGRYEGALQAIHSYAPHELGSLTGRMCKLTCAPCVAAKALGLPTTAMKAMGTSDSGSSAPGKKE